MKRLFLLSAIIVGLAAIITGCSSVPDHVNMTGKWQYTYGSQRLVATMNLNQDGDNLSGTINSPDGQYDITGKVMGSKFTLVAKSQTETINSSCSLTSESQFSGRYTTDKGESGDMQGRRL